MGNALMWDEYSKAIAINKVLLAQSDWILKGEIG